MIAGSGLATPTPSSTAMLDPTPTTWDEELRTASALDASPESEMTEEATALPPEPDPIQTDAHPLAGLIYSSQDGLWIVDRGGESQLIIDQPNARLSPNGRRVVFQPVYDPDIWLADLNTGERRNLTESSGRFNGSPQWWSGQQDLLIFGSSEELGPGFGYPTTVRTDGSDYQILDQGAVGPLALSPDGQKLAYGSFAQTGKIYHWDGPTETFDPVDYGLALERIFQPAWSPDGRQLAWEVSSSPDTSGWSLGVAVFDLEAKTAELFHTFTPMGGSTFPHYLSWSPDGDWLAFVTFNEPGEAGRMPILWVAQPDGQGELRLGPAVDPIWSPDGQRLAYTGFDDTQSANVVWTYEAATGEQIQVLPSGSRVVQWMPPESALLQNQP
jgi:Tol biopolymer transport system component